jgi:hypothetical protein
MFNVSQVAGSSRFAAASFDGDWCGTKPPGPPIPHHGLEASLAKGLLERLGLNPQPLPPQAVVAEGAQKIGGGGGGSAVMLDDWCGTPWRKFPPPPPPPFGELGNLLGGLARF